MSYNKSSVPSKNQNRAHSGRASRRHHNWQRTLNSVGGYSSIANAVFAPADKDLCVVVEMSRGMTSDNKPFRNVGPRSS